MAAIYCKADIVKFQKRCNRELLTPEQYAAPHPNPANSYGKTYGEHREYLEFTVEQHAQLKAWCDELGITYSTSVWDLTSAKEIASLHPELIKIPSACNNHYEMLEWLCENYDGEIHVSLGMTTHEEEEKNGTAPLLPPPDSTDPELTTAHSNKKDRSMPPDRSRTKSQRFSEASPFWSLFLPPYLSFPVLFCSDSRF